ncbi:hypothetical protein SteCoe_15203 [Stentor coeruleus]|uniref:Uncharacterized protein n=1 Tax=Stentor coeruleus TaxID=5963 RepID=A0A1R2C438_9CILI|nr:hypothetical protein SteCoe_15203 [Stentor coeruleus]
MGACNCMSKKTDTASEVLLEKAELPTQTQQLATESVIVPVVVQPGVVLPPVKEVAEETAQDPNMLLSQAQAMFRAYLSRKAYYEFKLLPPPTFKVDLGKLPVGLNLKDEVKNKLKAYGEFKFPEPSGCEFRQLFKQDDLSFYQGEVISNKPSGAGTLIFSDGGIVEGYFLNGKPHGFGRYISPATDVYVGEFKDGKKHGKGKIEFVSGNTYEGDWKDDMCDGEGTEKHLDGFSHVGGFKNGLKSGFGKSSWPDGSTYEGYFLNDMYDGHGKYTWTDKEYDGDWKNSQMHGKGTFKFSDGRSYSGDYLEGNKHGYGTFVWPDGKRYEGQWVNGKQEGQGMMYNKGKKMAGIWKDGKFVEKIKNDKQANEN